MTVHGQLEIDKMGLCLPINVSSYVHLYQINTYTEQVATVR